MAYIKKMIETKTSNVSFWGIIDPAWEVYRRETYENTGKLTITRQTLLANGSGCIANCEDSRKRIVTYTFDNEATHDQFQTDRLGFDKVIENATLKQQYNANNNITLEYEHLEI
jgi:hypothetical protein